MDAFRTFYEDPFGAFLIWTIIIVVVASGLICLGFWWVSLCRATIGPEKLGFVFFRGKPWKVIGPCEIYFRYPRLWKIFHIDADKNHGNLGYNAQGRLVKRQVSVLSKDGVLLKFSVTLFENPRTGGREGIFVLDQEACWTWYHYEDSDIDTGVEQQLSAVAGELAGILPASAFKDKRAEIGAYLSLQIAFGDQFPGSVGVRARWKRLLANHEEYMQRALEEPDGNSFLEREFGSEFTLPVMGDVEFEERYVRALEAKQVALRERDAAIINAEKDAEVLAISSVAAKNSADERLKGLEAWQRAHPNDQTLALAGFQAATGGPATVTVQDVRGSRAVIVDGGGKRTP